jgi:hypothetical protein
MNKHVDKLKTELTFRGLEESLLLGWKEKIKTLKNHEEQRDTAGDKKYFRRTVDGTLCSYKTLAK